MNRKTQEWIGRYVEGSLDNGERRALLELLRSDRGAATDFLRQLRMHGLLQFVATEASASQRTSEERILYFLRASTSSEFVDRMRPLIRRGLSAETPAWTAWLSGRRALAMAAAVVAVAGFFLLFARSSGGPADRIAATENEVFIEHRGTPQPASPGLAVRRGDCIRTGPSSKAEIAMADGTRIALNERTRIVADKRGPVRELTLDAGEIYMEAAPQRGGRPIVLNRGRYDEAVVVGTRFEMARSETDTLLRVLDGHIQFGIQGKAVPVRSLQASRVRPDQAPDNPAAITLSDVAPWRHAPVYVDELDGNTLAAFWAEVRPADRVSVHDGFLTMLVRPVSAKDQSAATELTSQPIALMDRHLDIALARNVEDGRHIFLPMNAKITVEILDEADRVACSAAMHTCIFEQTHVPGTGYGVGYGDGRWETIRAKGSTPKIWRFTVAPSGRIGIGKEEHLLQSEGSAGKPLNSVRLRLRLTTTGSEPARMNWDRITVQRLDAWPAWRNATPED